MELKNYQEKVLERVDSYLSTLSTKKKRAERILELDQEENPDAQLGDYPRETWEELNRQRIIPEMRDEAGNKIIAPYVTKHDGLARSFPNICLKVPTGGGKTLLAAASVERVQTDYFKKQTGFVLWVVPSEAIYRQTWNALANREHPYRQMLERASGGRVKMLEKGDRFTKADYQNHLCVMVLMLQAAARKTKETLKMFQDSGGFSDFFPEVDDSEANQEIIRQVPNLNENDLTDYDYGKGILVKHSLGNALRLIQPMVIIDEGHKAYSPTSKDTIAGFNPSFQLELSATPNASAHQSNVLVNVLGTSLKDEQMIKLPINIENIEQGEWKQTLAESWEKIKALQEDANSFQAESGRYIRPILLVRAERTGNDQRDGNAVHADDVKEYLMEKCGVIEEAIRLKTATVDEIAKEDLLSPFSPVRVIITKDALREGWDCPFAYVLAVLSKTTANTALTQMIGRILRQPHAQETTKGSLNECYVFTYDQEVRRAVESVQKGLSAEGMGDLASQVRAGTGVAQTSRRIKIKRNPKYDNLPCILLPRISAKDDSVAGGYRELDYERDILGHLDWESLEFTAVEDFSVKAKSLKRSLVRLDVTKKDGQLDFIEDMENQEVDISEMSLDLPFLVRQLLEVIPNPWQGMRILEGALETLREKVDEEVLYVNRMELLVEMKKNLRLQVFGGEEKGNRITGIAETLFREKLENGEIVFKLMASNNPDLDWKMAQELEIDITNTDQEIYKTNGSALEKSLFAKVYEKELNPTLEKPAALYLDGHDAIYWWHRIAVKQTSYGLQGWQKNKIYPDLLACVHGSNDGKYKLSVLETKGEHLKGNDDSFYKDQFFKLLTKYAKNFIDAGELILGHETEEMTFNLLLESNWQQELTEHLQTSP